MSVVQFTHIWTCSFLFLFLGCCHLCVVVCTSPAPRVAGTTAHVCVGTVVVTSHRVALLLHADWPLLGVRQMARAPSGSDDYNSPYSARNQTGMSTMYNQQGKGNEGLVRWAGPRDPSGTRTSSCYHGDISRGTSPAVVTMEIKSKCRTHPSVWC